jgi:hypothetical protein
MAHFARIENNNIREVIVINNEALENKPFPESEPIGKFAGVGMTYDPATD